MDESKIDLHNNASLIYSYAEKEIDAFNKSIDNLISKLTSALGFSGVLLKFISDLPNDSNHFWIRVLGSSLLCISIGLCISGLFAKDAGNTIRTKGLLIPPETPEEPNYYRMGEEEYRLCIIRQWIKHIESLENMLDIRRQYLNGSIGILVTVGILYGLNVIMSSVH